MRKSQITKEDIDQIMNEKLPIGHWELMLGIGVVYETAPQGVKYSKPYLKYGETLWKAFRYDLYKLICDRKSKSPREWISDLVTGDIRNAIIGIAAVVTSKYAVSMGIAIPVTALIVKTGVLTYCEEPPPKPEKSIGNVLDQMLGRNTKKKRRKKKND